MNRFYSMEPVSDAEMYAMLQGLLGIGDYDEEQPWYKFRAKEVAKIGALRRSRGVTLRELARATRYCYARRISVKQTYEVFGFLHAAKQDAMKRKESGLATEVRAALDWEYAQVEPDRKWVNRLLSAQGPERRHLLDAWEGARRAQGHQASDPSG